MLLLSFRYIIKPLVLFVNFAVFAFASGAANAGARNMINNQFFGLVALKNAQIIHTIAGKTMMPVQNGQLAFFFSETFETDGRWATDRSERGPMHQSGKWVVEGSKYCIIMQSSKKICRQLWRKREDGKLYTTDMNSGSLSDYPILVSFSHIM